MDLKGRHMLTLKDFTSKELEYLIDLALEIKKNPRRYSEALKDKTLIMLFEKTSTRTRLSFEAGMTQLGGHAIFLDKRTTQFMIAEFIDEIRATMRFGDALMYRPSKHSSLVEAEKVAKIPIINALSEKYHPCQGMGDALTMVENSGGRLEDFRRKKIVYLGVANNVSNSLIMVCTKLGAYITLCVPEDNPPSRDPELKKMAKKTGLYTETTDTSCIADADFVYTDTWIDMEFFDKDGNVREDFRKEFERRKRVFKPFQVSKALLNKYNSKAKIMHNMACHPPYEITRDAIDHPNSIIFDQAENRLHIQKAILVSLVR